MKAWDQIQLEYEKEAMDSILELKRHVDEQRKKTAKPLAAPAKKAKKK